MMINTISPGSRGSLAASRPATAARGGPRFSHTAPQPGEIVYKPGSKLSLGEKTAKFQWETLTHFVASLLKPT